MLPNLPALAGAWEWSCRLVSMAGAEWTPLAPADPERWYLAFWMSPTNAAIVSPVADPANTMGAHLEARETFPVEYQKHGILAAVAWYGFAKGLADTMTVVEVFIRKPKG